MAKSKSLPTGMGLKFLALKEEDYYKLEKILKVVKETPAA
jgi:hypothetical protein